MQQRDDIMSVDAISALGLRFEVVQPLSIG